MNRDIKTDKRAFAISRTAEDKIVRVLRLMISYANSLRAVPEQERIKIPLPHELVCAAGNSMLKAHGLWVSGTSHPANFVGMFSLEISRIGDEFGMPTCKFYMSNK